MKFKLQYHKMWTMCVHLMHILTLGNIYNAHPTLLINYCHSTLYYTGAMPRARWCLVLLTDNELELARYTIFVVLMYRTYIFSSLLIFTCFEHLPSLAGKYSWYCNFKKNAQMNTSMYHAPINYYFYQKSMHYSETYGMLDTKM